MQNSTNSAEEQKDISKDKDDQIIDNVKSSGSNNSD